MAISHAPRADHRPVDGANPIRSDDQLGVFWGNATSLEIWF